jgi:hypothetical protein
MKRVKSHQCRWIYDNTPPELRALLQNNDNSNAQFTELRNKMKSALRVLMVYERLGWEGILGGGWMTNAFLNSKKTSQHSWDNILNIVETQSSWITKQVKDLCEEELNWLKEML